VTARIAQQLCLYGVATSCSAWADGSHLESLLEIMNVMTPFAPLGRGPLIDRKQARPRIVGSWKIVSRFSRSIVIEGSDIRRKGTRSKPMKNQRWNSTG
jgi:hypothetical protein